MPHSTITSFDATVHKTNRWIREVMHEVYWDDPQRAYHALIVVLHTLRDRLTIAEVADLSAQLPMLLRGAFYEGWCPNRASAKDGTREEFLEHIYRGFPNDLNIDALHVLESVLKVMSRHVTSGEIEDIKSVLPMEIRDLWPSVED